MTETVRLENMIEKSRGENKKVGVVRFEYLGPRWWCDIYDKIEGEIIGQRGGDTPSDAFIKAREQMEGE